jgi:hypothetical protein
MILFIALVFTTGCVAASVRRLFFVIEATPLDPGTLVASLRRRRLELPSSALRELATAFESVEGAAWEVDVVRALEEPEDARPALLGEAMTDLDFLTRRWARVPRVSASLASSFGFLLATVALRVGLSDLVGTLDESQVLSVSSAVLDAVDVAAVGLVGAAFCIALQYRARAALSERLKGAERFVELIESFTLRGHFAQPAGHASVAPPQTSEPVSSSVV